MPGERRKLLRAHLRCGQRAIDQRQIKDSLHPSRRAPTCSPPGRPCAIRASTLSDPDMDYRIIFQPHILVLSIVSDHNVPARPRRRFAACQKALNGAGIVSIPSHLTICRRARSIRGDIKKLWVLNRPGRARVQERLHTARHRGVCPQLARG